MYLADGIAELGKYFILLNLIYFVRRRRRRKKTLSDLLDVSFPTIISRFFTQKFAFICRNGLSVWNWWGILTLQLISLFNLLKCVATKKIIWNKQTYTTTFRKYFGKHTQNLFANFQKKTKQKIQNQLKIKKNWFARFIATFASVYCLNKR